MSKSVQWVHLGPEAKAWRRQLLDGDGKTQKRLRRERRERKGERCGRRSNRLTGEFIKPQKWVGNRRADRWRDETDRKTQQGSKGSKQDPDRKVRMT